MSKRSISVVIPAYNEEALVVDCVRSLKAQNYTGPVEIIVVDNNCTDNTAQLAREAGATVVFQPIVGVCAAREAGSRAATGEIIVSTDADTTFPSNWLGNIAAAFDNDPEIVAVGGTFILIDAPWWGRIYSGLIFTSVKLVRNLTGKLIFIAGSNTAFKKSAFRGYDITLTQGGDELVLLRQLKKEGKIGFLFDNPVLTSSRRLDKGFFHFMIFYVLDYFACLIFGKSMTAPRAVRLAKENK